MASCRRIINFIFIFLLIIFLNNNYAHAALRIISLYPGHTDNVIALGGADFLISVSENDDNETLPDLPRFSLRDGAEKFLAMRPDIVLTRRLAERLNPTLSDVLRRAGVRVESIDTPNWDNFPDYLRRLAGILNLNPEDGVEKLYALRNNIAQSALNFQQKDGKRAPKVFIEATSRELNTCAPDSWAAHLVELAGGVNIAKDVEPLRKGSAIAPFGLEKILKNLNSVNIYIIQQGAMNAATVEDVKARPWASAFNFNDDIKLTEISESILSRPSLLGLERGGRELLKVFYDLE